MRSWVIVPSAADVSMVIPYLPLPMPSKLSYSSGPVEGLVVASPDFTIWSRSVNIVLALGPLNMAWVARADRPLLLLTKSVLAVDSQVSRCQGSSTRPMPLPEVFSALASAVIWGRVSGGSLGLSPALVKAFSL